MNVIELIAPRLDAFRPASYPNPRPGPREVLIRLRAASLNFLDIAVATGNYPVPKFPLVPVADGAGEIADLGEGVDGWAVGDRVVPHFMSDWQDGTMTPAMFAAKRGVTRPGSLAEYVVVPASSLVAIPAHLSFIEASTLPVAATTAWRAVRAAGLGPHSTTLLLGTGGVSIFALQFAKAHGSRVIITSSSDEKLARARKLGADLTINYRDTPEWDAEALWLTDGRGADLVLETGGTETFPRSVNAAAMAGTVFVIGFLTGPRPTINVLPIMEKELSILGNNTGPVAELRAAVAAIAAHRLTPVVDETFEMNDAVKAYAHVAAGGRHFGKITLNVN
jgi:NADPH:quinone reductase-like Zn-dependent oxidoreductase